MKKLLILILLLNFYYLNINGLFNYRSTKNVIGYYSNVLKDKALKYHSLGEFCSTGNFDAITIGSLYWNQNMTQFYFECQDYYSIIQDKEKELGPLATKSPIKETGFSRKAMLEEQRLKDLEEKEARAQEELEKKQPGAAAKKKAIMLEKNTSLTNKCLDLRNDILKCQELGVKMIIQIGSQGGVGTFSNTSIATKEMAEKLASKIWSMFLYGDDGRREYQDKLRKASQESSDEVATFSSEDSLSLIDQFSDAPKEESSSSMEDEEDYEDDEESYQEEYSNDEDTAPPVLVEEDEEYVDEEQYSDDDDTVDEDAVDEDGNPIVVTKKKKTTKLPERKKVIPTFTPRPFGYGVYLDGIELSPMLGKSENYYHLAKELDRHRIPRKDLFIISGVADCSLLHTKKESYLASSTSFLHFNFDYIALDFVHNKQCDYWSTVSDQWMSDWAKFTVTYKYNQTKLILMASSNPKDRAYFAPKYFLMEYSKYTVQFPNMAGVYITDTFSASKVINSANHLDFSTEISNSVKSFDPLTNQVAKSIRPISFYTKQPIETKPPVTSKPISTKPPLTKGPIITKKPTNATTPATKPIITTAPIKKVNSTTAAPLKQTHAPLTQSPIVVTKKPTTTVKPTHAPLTKPPVVVTETPTVENISSDEDEEIIIRRPFEPPTKKPIQTPKPTLKPTTKPKSTPTPSPTIKIRPTHAPLTQPPVVEEEDISVKPIDVETPSPIVTKRPTTTKPKSTPTPAIKLRPTHAPLTQPPVVDEEQEDITSEPTIVETPSARPTHAPIKVTEKPITTTPPTPAPTEDNKFTTLSEEPIFLNKKSPTTQPPITTSKPVEPEPEPKPTQITQQQEKPKEENDEIVIKSEAPVFLNSFKPKTEAPVHVKSDILNLEPLKTTNDDKNIQVVNQQDEEPTIIKQPNNDNNNNVELVRDEENSPNQQTVETETTSERNNVELVNQAPPGRHKPISATEFDKNFFNKK